MCKTISESVKELAATIPASVSTTPCVYCFNMDHWVPVTNTIKVECRKCTDCPMYITTGEWERDHSGHSERLPAFEGVMCLTCSGIVTPGEQIVDCVYVEGRCAYVPVGLAEEYAKHGVETDANDPFSEGAVN